MVKSQPQVQGIIVVLITFDSYLNIYFRNGRYASEPIGEPSSLKGEPPGPGFGVRADL